MDATRPFVSIILSDSSRIFIQWQVIRLVDDIKPSHCRIWFDATHTIDIDGEAADEFLGVLYKNSRNTKGETLTEKGKHPVTSI
jgi:hypothetical protein